MSMSRVASLLRALVLIFACSVPSCEGFVPQLHSRISHDATFGAKALPEIAPRTNADALSRRGVVVSMNMFSRFGRVAKANINQVLNKLEDPEKVMTQAVEDLQKDLIKIRQSYAEVMATQKRMEKQREGAQQLLDEWYKRAQLALQNGEEDLAREALERKQSAAEQVETLTAQINAQAESLSSLYEAMGQLESKMTEAKAMKDQYVARARTAKTQTTVNDMLSGIGDGSMGAFEKMKDKVEALETQAEVSSNLLGASKDVSLESKFKALESGNGVNDELEQMKRVLSAPGDDAKLLGTADSEVDSELAKLKKEMDKK